MAYADYDFYRNTYLGNAIPEEDFPRLSERASDYIRAATRGLSDRVDGWQREAVQKAACAVADVLLDESILLAGAYSGEQQVSSETVGGWSRSFKAAATVSASELETLNGRKREALLLYLGELPAFSRIFKVRSYRCLHHAE